MGRLETTDSSSLSKPSIAWRDLIAHSVQLSALTSATARERHSLLASQSAQMRVSEQTLRGCTSRMTQVRFMVLGSRPCSEFLLLAQSLSCVYRPCSGNRGFGI